MTPPPVLPTRLVHMKAFTPIDILVVVVIIIIYYYSDSS